MCRLRVKSDARRNRELRSRRVEHPQLYYGGWRVAGLRPHGPASMFKECRGRKSRAKPGLYKTLEEDYRFAPKASRRPSQSFTTNSRLCQGMLPSPRVN